MKFIIKIIFFSFLFLNVPLFALIDNTKHNLSVSGSGTITAQSETEICVFCHIPHRARTDGKPLWNRSMPTTDYDMYDSDYLRRMNYDVIANNLGTANNTPGALSRQCLSCHDGTVAIGAVHVLHSKTNQMIAMDGVEVDGTMPNSATGFIGTDLTMHHPVGIVYNPTKKITFGDGVDRTMELKTSIDINYSDVKLFNYGGGNNYVECSSCHDPHKESAKFLLVDTEVNLAQNILKTCTSCHIKDDWIGSVHQSPPVSSPDYTDALVLAKYTLTGDIADMGCSNCHTPHNALGIPYLNRQVQEQTCFQGASSSPSGAACHGNNAGAAKNIEDVANRVYAHPIMTADIKYTSYGTHTNLDTLYGTGVVDVGGKGVEWSDNKHAVCMDCHNPHKAKPGTHTDITDGTFYGIPSANTNDVSPALKGVTGVQPTWPTEWTQPTAFTTLESSTKEYQICFKCHSYWGLGTTLSVDNPATLYPSLSDINVPMTDVAWEMNINNKSGHPVIIQNGLRGGTSYEPRAIPAAALLPPWNSNPGGNTMYCSDCHGADDELVIDPKGPHGSNKKFMLKSDTGNYYWPFKPAPNDTVLYNTSDINTAGADGLFCKNCHDLKEPHQNQWGRMENVNLSCVSCHVAIPHGSPVSRLIGYNTFPAPYDYNDNSLLVTEYKKNTVADANDISGVSCGGGSCHGGMGWGGVTNPDPFPIP